MGLGDTPTILFYPNLGMLVESAMGGNRTFRIGLLLPSSNTTMEPDFYRMAPGWVTIHTARMRLDEVTPEGLVRMADDAEIAAELLATADVDVIVYGCTTGSLVGGVEWEEDLVRRTGERTGIPTISTSRAVVDALQALGGGRVGVATPYTEVLNRLEAEFLEAHGLEVASIRGLGLLHNLDIGRTVGEVVEGLACEAAEGADVIFISCTNLPAVGLIDKLEAKLSRPVVTSNQASLWAALRDSGVKGIPGYGELLRDRL